MMEFNMLRIWNHHTISGSRATVNFPQTVKSCGSMPGLDFCQPGHADFQGMYLYDFFEALISL